MGLCMWVHDDLMKWRPINSRKNWLEYFNNATVNMWWQVEADNKFCGGDNRISLSQIGQLDQHGRARPALATADNIINPRTWSR